MSIRSGREDARDQSEHGRRRGDAAVLITAAEPSYAEQFAARRRKYAILMSARIPCLILAGVFYRTWWLALAFVVLAFAVIYYFAPDTRLWRAENRS